MLLILNTIQDIIANLAIVTAYLFISNQVIFKSRNLDSPATIAMKIKMGVVAGILGIVLMVFTVYMNGALLDFRQLAVIISALSGGIVSSIVTGIIIFLMRMFAFGAVNTPTIIASINTVIIAISVGMVCTKHLSFWKKWIYSLLICNVLTGIVFIINFGSKGIAPTLTFICMMTIGGILTAYLMNFLFKAKAHFQQLEKDSSVDFLTGLNNHRTFDEKYNSFLQSAEMKGECLSLVFVDIDYFKKVNDTYGHANGDTVLQQLGEILRASVRSFDTVSRNGGEEFSVLLYNTPLKDALIMAEKMRMAVSKHSFLLNDGNTIRITVSIGVAAFPDTKREQLIEQADSALYKAKQNGRNLVCSNRHEA